MQTDQLHTQVLELRVLLSLLWKALSQHIDSWLAENNHDISRLQLGVLRFLSHEGAHTLSELSRKFGVDPSTLVPTVDGLERRELVRRERDPNDRRRFPISLTETGAAFVADLPHITAGDPILLAAETLGPADTEQLLQLICRMIHAIPDGETQLKNALPRLLAYGAKETYLSCKLKPNHNDR
jgi:DNA-binding MarR family transcriptional regulator